MNRESFGSESHPLRPSSLGKLVQCPMQVFLQSAESDESGEGANVGTAVHKGVEAWHHTLSSDAALEAMRAALKTFRTPVSAAGVVKAERWTAAYVADARNGMRLTHVETPVRLDLPGGVVIKGTLDQIRDNRVWDLKNATYITSEMGRLEYQFQQAAYVLAGRQTLGLPLVPGGLIWTAAYDEKRGNPFVPMDVTVAECEEMLEEVRLTVLDFRAGRRQFRPSASACKYCPQPKFPVCSRKLRSLL